MVLCVPLAHVIDQINQFHRDTESTPVTVVSVFRDSSLTIEEQHQLTAFVYAQLQHPIFAGNADDLRRTPLSALPPNVVAGLPATSIDVAWGQDPWLDTYKAEEKIDFLQKTLTASAPRSPRNNLLVLGWTVTPHLYHIVMRVLTLGFVPPSVLTEAVKMNERFPNFLSKHDELLKTNANVIFFDAFTEQLAQSVQAINFPDSNGISNP